MIDLHMHSRYSEDGEFTPFELVRQCDKKGIRIMSVTDHNCAKANDEAAETAKKNGITYIPGIEIDCIFRDTNFHLALTFGAAILETSKRRLAARAFRLLLRGLPLHRN